ncbi:MAG: hypothetical protein LBS49_05915 [Candidatus Accumulibacter sp.]|jgi:hypothetical protein|nr:hypothetical protein [Accumulibacter sp.]
MEIAFNCRFQDDSTLPASELKSFSPAAQPPLISCGAFPHHGIRGTGGKCAPSRGSREAGVMGLFQEPTNTKSGGCAAGENELGPGFRRDDDAPHDSRPSNNICGAKRR